MWLHQQPHKLLKRLMRTITKRFFGGPLAAAEINGLCFIRSKGNRLESSALMRTVTVWLVFCCARMHTNSMSRLQRHRPGTGPFGQQLRFYSWFFPLVYVLINMIMLVWHNPCASEHRPS